MLQLPAVPNYGAEIAAAPSPLDMYGKVLQLKALQGQQQLLPYQLRTEQLRNQQLETANQTAALELKAKQAYNNYWSNPDKYSTDASDFAHNDTFAQMLGISPDDPLMATVRGQIKAGVPADHAFAEAKNTLGVRQEYAKATQEQQTVMKGALEQLREISAPIMNEKDPTKKQQLLAEALPGLNAWAKFDPTLAPIIPQLNAGNFDAFANRLGAEEKAFELAKKQADAATEQQKVIPPGGGLSPDAAQQVKKDVAVAQQTQPLKIQQAAAEAEARQKAMQGDPAAAGQLLANGSLTLADLKTRGSTAKFIEQATMEAQKIDPKYNPADEIIAEHVAKSSTANQFFGSANSLIGKGGTLDQLEELGKKIPQHDWPVINTFDDWQKLARGKGPLAGYAATALGVADDYGKVMGGGNASDHARDAALNLFSKAASPEQRAQAIAATRNAVLSQRDGRIGTNKFLKREYGSGELGGQKVATQQHIADYARAKGITVQQAQQEAIQAGYTIQQ